MYRHQVFFLDWYQNNVLCQFVALQVIQAAPGEAPNLEKEEVVELAGDDLVPPEVQDNVPPEVLAQDNLLPNQIVSLVTDLQSQVTSLRQEVTSLRQEFKESRASDSAIQWVMILRINVTSILYCSNSEYWSLK